ncbi:Coat F domain-containing protein [Paenibacillus sp. 1_12]|uniref:spore coat protein n=1 Tax=Paenibacillus sp. 1_12 TaxID=1566278 RepID=UPI0008E3F498|nr:Coat F domain-containing protein [Paenibacillus sp. 1_12]
MYTQQQNNQQQSGAGKVSTKELLYVSDCLKNEDLMAKLAAQACSEAHTPQLKQQFSQIAQDRLTYTNQLLNALQQQSQMTH